MELARHFPPAVRDVIPHREISLSQGEAGQCIALAEGLQYCGLCETLQLQGRCVGGRGEGDIQLRSVGTGSVAAVGNRDLDGDESIRVRRLRDVQPIIFEMSVRQAVAKGIGGLYVVASVPTYNIIKTISLLLRIALNKITIFSYRYAV